MHFYNLFHMELVELVECVKQLHEILLFVLRGTYAMRGTRETIFKC